MITYGLITLAPYSPIFSYTLPTLKIFIPAYRHNKADRDPLPPGDLEFDGRPITCMSRAIETAPPDPVTRLEIGAVVEVLDEAAGIGRNCRFPFGATPDQSKEHGKFSHSP